MDGKGQESQGSALFNKRLVETLECSQVYPYQHQRSVIRQWREVGFYVTGYMCVRPVPNKSWEFLGYLSVRRLFCCDVEGGMMPRVRHGRLMASIVVSKLSALVLLPGDR